MKKQLLSTIAGLLLLAGTASAQDAWPSKPITLVMP